MIRSRTGLLIDSYFSATKIAWILDNVAGARDRAERGKLAFGTVDTWLVWNLTSGKRHITDRTNASRTMLYNIVEDRWDPELLRLLNIPESLMPEVVAVERSRSATSPPPLAWATCPSPASRAISRRRCSASYA